MTWLVGKIGERAAQWVLFAALICLFILGGLVIFRAVSHRLHVQAEAQAEQTTASGTALADAAADAVNEVAAQSVRETKIDAATAVALERIDHAENPADVRGAVVDALCLRDASYCEHPAR
jgi:uncharacterized membrane protein